MLFLYSLYAMPNIDLVLIISSYMKWTRGQIKKGKNSLTTKRLCVIGRELIFLTENQNLHRILFFSLSATRFGCCSVSLLTGRLKQNCMFSPPPTTPSISPPKQMRPRQESAEEIHTAWIRNTSTPARHRQPCCFRNCILHFTQKGASGYKIPKTDNVVAEWFTNLYHDNVKILSQH